MTKEQLNYSNAMKQGYIELEKLLNLVNKYPDTSNTEKRQEKIKAKSKDLQIEVAKKIINNYPNCVIMIVEL